MDDEGGCVLIVALATIICVVVALTVSSCSEKQHARDVAEGRIEPYAAEYDSDGNVTVYKFRSVKEADDE